MLSSATESAVLPAGEVRRPGHAGPHLTASLHFLGDGMIVGAWAALIPSFKSRFGLGEGELSIALLAVAAGAILSMPATGRSVSRHGSRANLRLVAPGFCLSLVLLALAPDFPTFILAALLFGALKGAFSVSVNSQAIVIENVAGRTIMPTFHALWSLGGMLAAFATGAALKLGIGPLAIASGTAFVLCCPLVASGTKLLQGDASSAPRTRVRFRLPEGGLLRIGMLTFMALFAEGVMMDWSVVYTRTVSHAAPWLAPFAYGVFSGCMATGRLAGSRLIARLGTMRVLQWGGILTAIGLSIIVGIHHWPATFTGLALTGLGLSNLAPILFSAGGRAHRDGSGNGIATVAMLGYFGFLIGPAVIGGIGHHLNLPAAFSVVFIFAAFIALRGGRTLSSR